MGGRLGLCVCFWGEVPGGLPSTGVRQQQRTGKQQDHCFHTHSHTNTQRNKCGPGLHVREQDIGSSVSLISYISLVLLAPESN